jgi:cob(I)alamin adenosyltransferase
MARLSEALTQVQIDLFEVAIMVNNIYTGQDVPAKLSQDKKVLGWIRGTAEKIKLKLPQTNQPMMPIGNRLACSFYIGKVYSQRAKSEVAALLEDKPEIPPLNFGQQKEIINGYLKYLNDLLFFCFRWGNVALREKEWPWSPKPPGQPAQAGQPPATAGMAGQAQPAAQPVTTPGAPVQQYPAPGQQPAPNPVQTGQMSYGQPATPGAPVQTQAVPAQSVGQVQQPAPVITVDQGQEQAPATASMAGQAGAPGVGNSGEVKPGEVKEKKEESGKDDDKQSLSFQDKSNGIAGTSLSSGAPASPTPMKK